VFTRVVPRLATELTRDSYGTFALQEPDDFRGFVLWGYLDEHMDVVSHEMAFQNFAIFLVGQLVEDAAEPRAYLTIQTPSSAFRDENKVVFTVPF